jgi:Fe-S-cluster containining protein
VQVSTGPMRLADLVPTAFELTDIIVMRAIARETKAGHPVTCRAGCGVCCSQMVPVSPPEVFYLVDMLSSLPSEMHNSIRQRFELITAVLEQRNMIDYLMEPEYSDDPFLAIARDYFSLNLPCPFLVDASCGIYEHRPVACRDYNVTSPAEWCTDPYSHEVAKVRTVLPLSAPLARLSAALTGSKPRLIPLTLAPRWVQEQNELRHHAWNGLELFQQFMAEVGRSHSSC